MMLDQISDTERRVVEGGYAGHFSHKGLWEMVISPERGGTGRSVWGGEGCGGANERVNDCVLYSLRAHTPLLECVSETGVSGILTPPCPPLTSHLT